MHRRSAWQKNMYRKGIGSAMARYLVDWAREAGWERIEGWAFANPEENDAYVWIPSVQFWEKAGMQREQSRVFDPSDPITSKPGYDFAIDLQQK